VTVDEKKCGATELADELFVLADKLKEKFFDMSNTTLFALAMQISNEYHERSRTRHSMSWPYYTASQLAVEK
jgi:hypothetical protein